MRHHAPTAKAVEFAHRVAVAQDDTGGAAAQDGTKVKTLRGSVFIRGVTEIGKNEASAVPSAHFDHISGRAKEGENAPGERFHPRSNENREK